LALGKLKSHLDNIAFSHSVFALPFAYMGAFLAAGGLPGGGDLFWITVAMVGARSAALALNNLIDLKFDKLHPRFTARPMVTGAVKRWEAALFIAVSLAVFVYAAYQLHPLARTLWPLAVVPFAVYPYMKRFSWTCHLVLGVALAGAPVGAWIAIRGDLTAPVALLAAAVGVWIAAFDVIYGCQDVAFDKAHRLHSMPVRFGVAGALRLARLMHAASVAAFVAAGWLAGLGPWYYAGVALAAGVLVYQHSIVSAADLSRVTQAYFMRNGLVGMAIFLFTVLSLIL
jgi:4-hydroxybenzoate polyprenyltransferase